MVFLKAIFLEGVSVEKIKLHAFSGVQYRFKKETSTQVFFCEISKIIKNTISYGTPHSECFWHMISPSWFWLPSVYLNSRSSIFRMDLNSRVLNSRIVFIRADLNSHTLYVEKQKNELITHCNTHILSK